MSILDGAFLNRIQSILSKQESLEKLAADAKAKGDDALAQTLQNEAETAAGLILKLLKDKQLSVDEIRNYSKSDEEHKIDLTIFFPKQHGVDEVDHQVKWQMVIASAVCNNFNCKYLAKQNTNRLFFIGHKDDRVVAVIVFGFLVREMVKAVELSWKFHQEQFPLTKVRKFEYIYQYAVGAGIRIDERFQQINQQAIKDSAAGEKEALMVINNRAIETANFYDDFKKFYEEKQGKPLEKPTVETVSERSAGYVDGYIWGNTVPLGQPKKELK